PPAPQGARHAGKSSRPRSFRVRSGISPVEYFVAGPDRLTSHRGGWEDQAQSSGTAFVRTPAAPGASQSFVNHNARSILRMAVGYRLAGLRIEGFRTAFAHRDGGILRCR